MTIRTSIPILLGVIGLLVVASGSTVVAEDYLGSDFCANCHITQHNEWTVSGHPWKLVPADVAQNREVPLPQPPLPAGVSSLTWDDVSYVIGGFKWKIRFVGSDGYIITSVDTDGDGFAETPGMNQYNMVTGGWVDYHPGEMKPYNCGSCHTTGWVADDDWDIDGDLSDNQDGLPGIHGTFAFGGVQCEACHGPKAHLNPDYDGIDDSAEFCGSCHFRGDVDTIPAKGGFIRHHEQYNEMLASPHAGLSCVDCHNPHKRSEFSIEYTCADCHPDIADSYAGSVMEQREVTCIDCHMPYASKSAVATAPFRGDVRTHLFRINTDKDNQQMFTDDGGFVLLDDMGQGAVNLDFACVNCHTVKSTGWIEGKAKNFHQRGKKNQKGEPGEEMPEDDVISDPADGGLSDLAEGSTSSKDARAAYSRSRSSR